MTDLDLDPTRYLLGELTDAERDAFEARFLADDEAHELVRAAEDDLFDAYAAGDLSPGRRAAFEQRFLADPAGQARLAAARLLALRSVAPIPIRRPARRRLFFVAAGLAAAGVAAAAAVVLFVWLRPPPERPRSEGSPEVALLLVPATRGASIPSLALAAGTERVRLEPEVGGPVRSVRLRSSGGEAIPLRADGEAYLVEAAALAAGRHELIVELDGGELQAFPFDVHR